MVSTFPIFGSKHLLRLIIKSVHPVTVLIAVFLPRIRKTKGVGKSVIDSLFLLERVCLIQFDSIQFDLIQFAWIRWDFVCPIQINEFCFLRNVMLGLYTHRIKQYIGLIKFRNFSKTKCKKNKKNGFQVLCFLFWKCAFFTATRIEMSASTYVFPY